jgi:hypothetical protein
MLFFVKKKHIHNQQGLNPIKLAIAEQLDTDIDYINITPLVLEIIDYSKRTRWCYKFPDSVTSFMERYFKFKYEGFSCPNPFEFEINDTICHIIDRMDLELDLQ